MAYKNKSDWNKYNQKYRHKNPERVLKWRAKSAANLLKRLEKQQPEQEESK